MVYWNVLEMYLAPMESATWLNNTSAVTFVANEEIYILDVTERKTVNLTNSPGYNGDPDWWWPGKIPEQNHSE